MTAALRCTAQLVVLGSFILVPIFNADNGWIVLAYLCFMLLVAAREASARALYVGATTNRPPTTIHHLPTTTHNPPHHPPTHRQVPVRRRVSPRLCGDRRCDFHDRNLRRGGGDLSRSVVGPAGT